MNAEGMLPIRTLEWYNGYIYAVEEGMYSLSAMPMTQKLLITTKRMDINSIVKLDRRFPETYGFWWEEYKEPEPVITAAEEDSEPEENNTPHITSAAWLDKEDNPVIFIPTALDETVTMHIETTGFDNPENDDEEVLIEIKDEEKKVLFDYTTRPNEEGVIDLDITVEEILSEKHDKPTEYLKEHPDLKLSLFASRLHNPDEQQEAILEKEKPSILTACFQGENGEELTEVPAGENKYVDIFIEIEKYRPNEEGKCQEILCFEILDGEGELLYKETAPGGANGTYFYAGFDLISDIDTYRSQNSLPPLTTRSFSYILRAWVESNPGEVKQTTIQEEPKCTVQFRRPKNYDGSFFFDWLRTGDTYDPNDPIEKFDKPYKRYYQENDRHYYNYLNTYKSFIQPWRSKSKKWKPTERYFVPWVGIPYMEGGKTIELRMLLEMDKAPGKITFKIEGSGENVLSIESEKEITVTDTDITWLNPLKVKCTGIIEEETEVNAYAGETILGQFIILPNKPQTMDIIPVYVDYTHYRYNFDHEKYLKEDLKVQTVEKIKIEKAVSLFKQVNIDANFSKEIKLNFIDLKEVIGKPKYDTSYKSTIDATPPMTSVFSSFFATRSPKTIETTLRIETDAAEYRKYNGMNIFEYLDAKLFELYANNPTQKQKIKKATRLYIINSVGCSNRVSIKGKANPHPESPSAYKTAVVFNHNNEVTGPLIFHEILHNLGLDHPFEMRPTFLMNGEDSCNIMCSVRSTDYRVSLWKWQWDIVVEKFKERFK